MAEFEPRIVANLKHARVGGACETQCETVVTGEKQVASEVPLLLHAQYLDMELSAAFHAVTQREGFYRNFYTGVETVANDQYDLLLVNLSKGDKEDHLKY